MAEKRHGEIGKAGGKTELDLTKCDVTTLTKPEHLQNSFICLSDLPLKIARPSSVTDVVTVSYRLQGKKFLQML